MHHKYSFLANLTFYAVDAYVRNDSAGAISDSKIIRPQVASSVHVEALGRPSFKAPNVAVMKSTEVSVT